MAGRKLPIITGTSLSIGDVLRWDGSNWVNYPDSNYGSGYVDRGNTSVSDFDEGDSPTTDAWADLDLGPNGLNIVPAGAKAVALFLRLKDNAHSQHLLVRKKGSTSEAPGNVGGVITQTSNVPVYNNCIIGCDSNGVIEYYLRSGTDEVDITVTGWFL